MSFWPIGLAGLAVALSTGAACSALGVADAFKLGCLAGTVWFTACTWRILGKL